MLTAQLDEIRHVVKDIVESERLELVDVEYKEGKARSLLRIYIDKDGGVTLSDCENVSRQLSAVLDVKDLLNGAYILEVSSPGVDRTFQTDRDYFRSIGRTVKILAAGESIMGRLTDVNDESITLDVSGTLRMIPRSDIQRAQQEIGLVAQPKHHKKHK